MSQATSKNAVGPVLQAGEFADAVIEAIRDDNPGKTVQVHTRASYVRIEVDGECTVRRETVQAKLGRPFKMSEMELNMPSFAGQIETGNEQIRFYFDRAL